MSPLTADQVLAHVEQMEYLKARAKQAALEAADADPIDLVHHDGEDERLRDAILLALIPWARLAAAEGVRYSAALGYDATVPPSDVEEVVRETVSSLGPDAGASLTDAVDRIHEQVAAALAAGVSSQTVLAALQGATAQEAWLAPVRAVAGSTAIAAVTGTERAVVEAHLHRTAAAPKAPRQFDWLTVGDGAECEGTVLDACAPRAGLVRPLSDWLLVGLPGAAHLRCSLFSRTGISLCRCSLRLHTGEQPSFTQVDAAEAIKNGKKRAEAA